MSNQKVAKNVHLYIFLSKQKSFIRLLMNEKCMKTKEKPKKVKLFLDVGQKLITQIKKSKPKMKST